VARTGQSPDAYLADAGGLVNDDVFYKESIMPRNRNRGKSSVSSEMHNQPRGTSASIFDKLPLMKSSEMEGVMPASGRRLVTYGYEDPYATLGVGLFGFQYDKIDLTCFFSGGTVEPAVKPLQDFTTTDMYMNLVVELINERISFNQFNLTTAGNLNTYLNDYAAAFGAIRGLQALIELHGYNRPCDDISRNLWMNKSAIEARLNRLETYPFPPKMRAALDDLFGVYLLDGTGLPPMYSMIGGPLNDLTSQTDINNILTNIVDPAINNMSSLTPASDSALIVKALKLKYGDPQPIGAKSINTSAALYYLHLSQAYQYQDLTSGNTWVAPCLGSTTVPNIPIWVYGGNAGITPYTFTLLRPTVFANNQNVVPGSIGTRGAIGFTPNSTVGTYIDGFNQSTGARGTSTGSGAGPTTAVTLNDWVNETLPWARIAQLETGVSSQVTTDGRILDGWTRFYVAEADMVDETVRFLRQLYEL
jgi:hypothetical protein